MSFARTLGPALVALSLIALTGCENAEVKAQRKFETAMALIADGELEKANVELRGVFDLNPDHYEARMAYADLSYRAGSLQEAVGHYLLATEQRPDDPEPRIKLVEIFIFAGAWDQIDTHVDAAARVAPEDPRVKTLVLAKDFRDAAKNSETDFSTFVTRARAALDIDPSSTIARSILVDGLIRSQDFYGAIEALDAGLELTPDDKRANELRLRLLDQVGDIEGVGEQLRTMVERFPDDNRYGVQLVRWYLSRGDQASADAFMQSRIAAGGDAVEPRVSYVQFLLQTQGAEAALAQLETFVAEDTKDKSIFLVLRASTLFDMGRRDEAISAMVTELDGAEPSDTVRNQQLTLARMYLGVGETDKAYALVDTVLEQDAYHVDALKLRANQLIEADRVGDAIVTLRSAQDQAPQDPDIFTLMAKAYERDGIRDLMGENLAQAVQNSDSAVAESLRYAKLLTSQEKFQSARDVVVQSLRRNPTDLQLLQTLAEIYLGMADYPRAEQVVKALNGIDNPQAKVLANALEATILQRLQRTDESLALMRGMLDNESTALVAQAAIIRTHLANNDVVAARTFMDDMLAENPDEPGTQFLNAALLSVEGNIEDALVIYRKLLDDNPAQEVVWRAYVAGLSRLGRSDEALSVLDEAITTLPEAQNLLWLKASYEEQAGNIDSAIAIYQELYEKESNSAIVANNLASLITSYRDNDEDLQRANIIVRRLKDTKVPAFQDTYGWIAYRMGRAEEAVDYLSASAAALPSDPLVREHYGTVLAALGRNEEAAAEFEAALALVPEARQEQRDRLQAALAATKTTQDTPAAPAAPGAQ